LSAKFTQNLFSDGGTPETFLVNSGSRLPVSRDYTVSAYITHRAPLSNALTLVTHADVAHVSESFVDLGTTDLLASYVETNLRFGIESDRWSITAFADNLLDVVAEAGFAQTKAFGVARSKPQTLGVRANLKF
jgi:hypothetical protein